MVDNSIPVRGRTDLAFLGFVNQEAAVTSGAVRLGGQFLVQLPQGPFLIEVERSYSRTKAFASARLKADDLIPQVAVAFHDLLPLLLSQPPTSLPISSMDLAAKP